MRCILLSLCALLWAQGKSTVTTAALALQDQEYEKAIQYAQKALSQPDLLKGRQIAKAYAVLGQAYIGLLATSKDPLGVLQKYPDLFFQAAQAIQKSTEYDESKTYENELKIAAAKLSSLAYLRGFELFKKEDFHQAVKHLDVAVQMYNFTGQKDFFPVYTLRGLSQLQLKDTLRAIQDLETSVSLARKLRSSGAKENPMMKVLKEDNTLPFAYAALINIYGNQNKIEQALEYALEAKNLYPDDPNIRNAELNLYLKPALQEKALARFQEELKKDPQNETYNLIVAQILEKTNPDSAVYYYKKVLAINPNNLNANYNMGAYYVNQAAEIAKLHNEASDPKKQEEYYNKMIEKFRLALPYLEKAHEQLPEDLAILQSLIQVSTYLGMEDKAKTFLQKKNQILNKKE